VTRVIGQGIQTVTGGVYPLLDIFETEDSVVIRTSPLDGVVPDSIEVSMDEDMLTVIGETRGEDEIDGDAYLLRERRFGKFSRTVRIPRLVKAEEAQAKFKAGILTITLPKIEDSRRQVIDVTETE
jgi:HSP20 family protein